MKSKRFVSFILAVMICVCQMPFSSFASSIEGNGVFYAEKEECYDVLSMPVVTGNSDGTVTLKKYVLESDTAEYGYTKNTVGEPSFWQDENVFQLEPGIYYFYARIKENEFHLAGNKSSHSKKIQVISEKPSFSISYDTPVVLGEAVELIPTIEKGIRVRRYTLSGTLPEGLNFNRMGVIKGISSPSCEPCSVTVKAESTDRKFSNKFTIEFIAPEVQKEIIVVCPETLTYGDNGQFIKVENNVGEVSFEVTGDAVAVDPSGKIKTLKAGNAEIKVTAFDEKNKPAEKIFNIAVLPAKPDASMVKDIPDAIYTGVPLEPEVLFLSEEIKTGSQISISYGNNIYAGTAFAEVGMKGNYDGFFTKSFSILPAAQNPYTESTASVFAGGNTLDLKALVQDIKGSADFNFIIHGDAGGSEVNENIFKSGQEAGNVILDLEILPSDINGDGKEETSRFFKENAVTVEVLPKTQAGMTVTLDDVTYGEEINPDFFKIADSKISLLYEGKNYKGEEFKENFAPKDAGDYKLTVTEETADTLYIGSCNFKILKKDIKNAVIFKNKLQYNGEVQKPVIEKIELDGENILPFCKVTEAEGKYRGSYSILAEALEMSNYKGTASDVFIIEPKEIEAGVSLDGEVFYTGKEAAPKIKVTDGETILEEGKDYMLSCENNIFAGEGKAVISENPKGNYTFKDTELSFEIQPVCQKPVITENVKIKTGGNILKLSELIGDFKGEAKFNIKGEASAYIDDGNLISTEKAETFYLDISIPAVDVNGDGISEYLPFNEENAVKVEIIQRDDAGLKVENENITAFYGDAYDIKASADNGKLSFSFKSQNYDSDVKPKDAGNYKVIVTAEDKNYYSQKILELTILPKEKELKQDGNTEKLYDGGEGLNEDLKLYFDGEYEEGKIEVLFKNAHFENADAGEEKKIILGEHEGKFENYKFKLPEIKGSIKKRPVTAYLSEGNIEREYDGTENLSAPDLKFRLKDNFEDIEITAVNNKFLTGNAGENKPIIPGTLKGKGLNNYEVTYPEVFGSIFPKETEVWLTGPETSLYKEEFSHGAELKFPQELVKGDELKFSVLYDGKAEKPSVTGKYELSAVSENPNYTVKNDEVKTYFEILKAPFNAAKDLTFTVNLKDTKAKVIKKESFGIVLPGKWEISDKNEDDIFAEPLNVKDGNLSFALKEGLDRISRGKGGAYKLKFIPEDKNYEDAEISFTIKTTSGDAANISFTQSKNTVTYGEEVTYLLSAHNEKLSGEVKFYFDGSEEPSRISEMENGKISFTLDKAHLKAGKHTMRAVFDDAEAVLVTEVSKRKLSYDVSDLKAESKKAGTEGETEIYGKLYLEGILEGDEVNVKPFEELETEGFDKITEAGDHIVSVAGDFETDNANYQLPEENPKISAHVNEVLEILAEEESFTYKILAEKGVTDIPEAFEGNINLDSPLKVRETLRYKLIDEGIEEENISLYDINVLIKEGENWVEADESFFKKHGKIKIKLPYPENSKITNDFIGVHMFFEGENQGEIESLKIEKEKEQISFDLTGLSPVAVGFKERKNSHGGSSSHRNKILQDFENEFWESVAQEIYYAYPESVIGVDAIGFDKMNWQVMDALHYNPSVTLVLTQYGQEDIVIFGEDALEVSDGRIFYKLSYLREVYNNKDVNYTDAVPGLINPETGSYSVFIKSGDMPEIIEEQEKEEHKNLLPAVILSMAAAAAAVYRKKRRS